MASDSPLSFAKDIRPLFTDSDVSHRKPHGMDLSSHAVVAKQAESIFGVVSAGTMPPPEDGGDPWSEEMVNTFKRWMDQGCPP
ncbi:MAG: hypothetical protein ABSF08_13975 [Candidatus Cybelea sp.]|jgi:hypothetical protein